MAGSSNDDPAWILLIVLGIFFGIGWAIWHFFEPQFLEGLRYVRLVEMAPLVLVDWLPWTSSDRQYAACFSWLMDAEVGVENLPTAQAYSAALGCFGAEDLSQLPASEAMKYYAITTDSLGVIGRIVGGYLRWFLVIAALIGAYMAIFVSKRNGFKTRHTLESFIKLQAKIWPVIAPIANFNPSKASARIPGTRIPDKIPPFAEAFAPEEWLSFHRISVENGIPDRESVRRALLKQLGPRWTGYDALPVYMQALAAAFALKGVQRRDESDDFLGKLSLCWSVEKGFAPSAEIMGQIRKILKDPDVGGKALEIAAKHAYRTTALLGTLKWARYMGGVLAAAQFLWLRAVDRELWYALNNLGRRSFHMEGAGAMAHYMAEEGAQKALPTPRLDTAIVTLNIYMGGDNPIQVPPREEPKTSRR